MRACFRGVLFHAALLATSIGAGLIKNKENTSSVAATQKSDMVKSYRVGQVIKTRLYGAVEVLKVHDDGVIIQKISTGSTRYDPFPVRTADFDTLSESKIPDRVLKEMQNDSERYAAKRQEKIHKQKKMQTENAEAGKSHTNRAHDIPVGKLVRVKSTSFKEKTSEPSMHAVCEAKTVLRRMPDGYYRGSIHCGGSAYYTFTVGAEIEEIKDKPPAEQSHNVRRCIERCLEKCGRPALGKEPSYGNTVCTQGCQPSCESTWGRN